MSEYNDFNLEPAPKNPQPNLGDSLQLLYALTAHGNGHLRFRDPAEDGGIAAILELKIEYTPDGLEFDRGIEVARIKLSGNNPNKPDGFAHLKTYHVFKQPGDATSTVILKSIPKDMDNLGFFERMEQDKEIFEDGGPKLTDENGQLITDAMQVPDISEIFTLTREIELANNSTAK